MIDIIISGKILFITIHVSVVNKITTNPNFDWKNYWKQDNVQCAKRFTHMFILS